MNASGCREPSAARHLPPAPPGRAGGLGEAWGSREPVRGGTPARQVTEPSVPRGAAVGCWRVPGAVLALLLLLCPAPSPACPAACRCSPGEVDCSERGLREVPWSLSPNTSALWLGYNFITVLGPRSFPLLPGLRLLSLVHNRLELIHSQALLGLGALQELDLGHNHLTVLTPDTFLPLTSLATLNLGSNRLGQLEPGVLDALPQLQALLLQDNPWVCSCGILPLWRWLTHNREKVREKSLLLCRVPEQLNKYPIMAFGDESFRQCQETSLYPQHYIAFFIIGPFSFIASIFFCTFLGSLVVFYHSLRRDSHCWRRPRVCRVH